MEVYLVIKRILPLNKVLSWVILALSLSTINAQQDPQFTQYMFNTMIVNPAYAGSKGHTVFTALGRTQWNSIPGAPKTQSLSYDSPIGYAGLGLGINIMNDEIGPSSELYFDGNLSYTIETGMEGNLAFGLRLGGRQLRIDWSEATPNDGSEPVLQENISKFLPTVGAGLYYYEQQWYVGLSVPNFLGSEHYDADRNGEVAVEALHFYFISGYVFEPNENLKIKPAVLLKGVSGAPLSLDVSVNALFNEKFRAGIGWRWGDSISALLGFQVADNIMIGYGYDLTTSNYNIINNGTHEIMLRYELFDGPETRYMSPRFF